MSSSVLHIIRFRSSSVLDRLMLDEALFRDPLKRMWLVVDDSMSVRAETSVILGLSGKLDEMVHELEARRDNVNLIRRFTGGGTVAVDKNAFLVSIVANASAIVPTKSVPPYPREIMKWTDEQLYRPAFEAVSTPSDWTFKSRENDYVINESFKVGGNAQGISNDRFCHHTSFLWQVNAKTMSYLKFPKKRPEYREERDHLEFLRGLDDVISSRDEFYDKVAERFALALGLRYPRDTIEGDEGGTAFQLPPILKESRNRLL